jgi:molybdenum cofactor biosynthesis protein MoaC
MIDVSPKFCTLRYALAEGFLYGSPATLRRVADKTVPKGDVVEVARAAGISAAKRCADWIIFCHPIPLDLVEVSLAPEENRIRVTAEVRSIWKTGVEMEAITAVSAALLNAYDMLKPLDGSLSFGDIRVVRKKGGKSDFTDSFAEDLRTALLVISDSTHAGRRQDTSGPAIREFLADKPLRLDFYEVLPDDREVIAARLRQLADEEKVRLIFTTGGTGLGPRDVTPEATLAIIDRSVPGIVEAIRSSVIINLPGSATGSLESLQALFPGLLHIFSMMAGEGHGPADAKEGGKG